MVLSSPAPDRADFLRYPFLYTVRMVLHYCFSGGMETSAILTQVTIRHKSWIHGKRWISIREGMRISYWANRYLGTIHEESITLLQKRRAIRQWIQSRCVLFELTLFWPFLHRESLSVVCLAWRAEMNIGDHCFGEAPMALRRAISLVAQICHINMPPHACGP